MKIFQYDARKFFLFGSRIFFGSWLLYVGLAKWIFMGSDTFVEFIVTEFDKTWSPHALNTLLAWGIIISEPLLGVLILVGKSQRLIWSLTALLMFLLTVGQTILMKPEVIANWQYLIFTLVCAALSEPEKV